MTKADFIHKAVGRMFAPADPAKAARNQVFITVGSGLIALAAWRTDGWLSWLLFAWLAYRVLVLGFVFSVGSEAVTERERRLSSLPSGWRDFLMSGKKPLGVSYEYRVSADVKASDR